MALSSTTLQFLLNTGEVNTIGWVSQPYPVSYQFAPTSLTDGTGANAAQKVATQLITVNTSGTTIDLTAMTGGPGNAAVNFTKVKALVIENQSAVVINVGNAGSNPWTGICSSGTALINIQPGGVLFIWAPSVAGLAVSGGSKAILIAAASATALTKITAVGEGS